MALHFLMGDSQSVRAIFTNLVKATTTSIKKKKQQNKNIN